LRHAFAQVKPVSQVAKGTIRTFNVPKSTLATSITPVSGGTAVRPRSCSDLFLKA
jgi:hypothetical protein